jgi:hypothetical protein
MNVHKKMDDEKLPYYVEERQKSRERMLTQIQIIGSILDYMGNAADADDITLLVCQMKFLILLNLVFMF